MTEDAQQYNIAAIRQLLRTAFDAKELRRFCEDRPDFAPVVTRFGPGHSLDDIIDELITFCKTKLLFDKLLPAVKDLNPKQYERFEPYTLPDPHEPDEPPPPPPPFPPDPFLETARAVVREDPVARLLVIIVPFLLLGALLLLLAPQCFQEPPGTPTPTSADTEIPGPSDTPAPTATDTPTPTATNTPTPTATSTSLVRLESELNACGPWQIPAYIDHRQDPLDAAVQLYAIEPHSLPVGPFRDQFLLTLNVTSTSQDSEWIQLENTALVSVQVHDVPESVNFWRVKECGAGGFFWTFSEGELTADRETYTFSVTCPEVDYFTLAPGAFDGFHFPLRCGEPGIYQVRVELPYKYKGESGTIVFPDSRPLICPKSYSVWEAYAPLSGGSPGPLEYVGDFEWSGTGYETTR